MKFAIVRPAGALLALTLLAVGCSGTDNPTPGGSEGITIVATTSILGDVVTEIVGADADVVVLMGPGQEPHAFRPSAAQAARLSEADLIVSSGLQLEEGLLDTLAAAESGGTPILRVGDALDPIPIVQPDRPDVVSTAIDPHWWLDPLRMADAVTLIGDRLAAVDPAAAATWTSGAAAYRSRVLDAHRRVAQILDTVPPDRRVLVTNHGALGYFATRYGFRIVGTVIPGATTLAEPSPSDLANLITRIQENDVPAIFVEATLPQAVADAVAAEVDHPVAVVRLWIGALGEAGSGADTYLGLITSDAQLIADALGGS